MSSRTFVWRRSIATSLALPVVMAGLVLTGFAPRASAASLYWNGTGTSWDTASDWSTSITSNIASAAKPGSADVATFNMNTVTGANVLLNNDQSALGLSFNVNDTGGATLVGGNADHTLTIGASGIGQSAGAGAVVIGSATSGQGVSVLLSSATESFTNNSNSSLTFLNSVSNTLASTLTLTGAGTGGFNFGGPVLTGTGALALTINLTGGAGVNLTGNSASGGYAGATTITAGTLTLSGAGRNAATPYTINAAGSLVSDNTSSFLASGTRFSSGSAATLNGGSIKVLGTTIGSGNEVDEALATITLSSNRSTITATSGNADNVSYLNFTNFSRAAAGGTALLNGTNLGMDAGSAGVGRIQLTGTTVPTLVGTSTAISINPALKNTKIVPFLVGESGLASGQTGTTTGVANTFLTYVSPSSGGAGFRPLNPTDEFTNNAITAGNNTYITAATTGGSTAAINSLVINGGDLTMASGTTLTNTSGALLFASSNTIGGGTYQIGATGTSEGIINLNSGVTGAINSAITTTGGLTVDGAGTLALGATNSGLTGTVTLGTGTSISIGANNAIGTGAVKGGTIFADNQARSVANLLTTGSTVIAGTNDLTLTGNGAGNPAMAQNNFANNSTAVTNTGVTTFSGVVSLLNAASGHNNGGSTLILGSSANVVISGGIQDNNAGNDPTATNGPVFNFLGTGGNYSIIGNNSYGKAGLTSGFVANNFSYNTVTLGGPGGTGATITPFGATSLFFNINNGQGIVFIKAATNGQILGNALTEGASSNGFGFTGANDLTLSSVTTGGTGNTITNLATGTLTFGGATALGNGINFLGTGATTFSSASSLTSAAAQTFSKTGPGVLTIAGTNALTSTTTLSGGTTVLDYSVNNNTKISQFAATGGSAAALSLGGANLVLAGGSFAQTLGTPLTGSNGTTITNGSSSISRTSGTSTIALGAITRAANSGGSVNFTTGIASTTTANTSGILGGWATVGGADFATGGGTIAALGAYDSFATPGANANILQTGAGSVATNTTVNSLKLATTGAGQSLAITPAQILTLTSGGLLFTGADNYSITGGTVRPGTATANDLIVHQYGAGTLTIGSVIANGGSGSSLTKTGPGTLALTGINTYTGTTSINGGTLSIAADSALGATGTQVIFNGGTLELTSSNYTSTRTTSLQSNGGTFQIDAGTLTLSGIVSGGYGSLTKTGAGTLLLSGTNTYTGPTNINAGTLKLGATNALGAQDAASNRSTSPVTVNGGSLDIAGFTTNIGNLYVNGGTVDDSVGTGGLNAYSYNLTGGTVNAKLGDVVITGNTSSNSINLYKTGAGTATIAGANTYTGATRISGGTLQVGSGGSTGNLGTGNVTTEGGAASVLAFNRSDSAYVVNNAISGNGGVAQTGSGITSLMGVNSYSGGTAVNAGTLLLIDKNTLQQAVGLVTVAGGSLASSVSNVNLGGGLAVTSGKVSGNGTGVGSITLGSGNLTMSGGELDFNLGTLFDTISSTTAGSFNLTGGSLLLDVTGAGFAYTNSYNILSGFGTGANSVSGLSINGYDTTAWLASLNATTGTLSFAAVPEPSTWAALVFGLMTLGASQRLRRRRA